MRDMRDTEDIITTTERRLRAVLLLFTEISQENINIFLRHLNEQDSTEQREKPEQLQHYYAKLDESAQHSLASDVSDARDDSEDEQIRNPVQCDEDTGHIESSPHTEEIRREGIILRRLAEEYLDSQVRRKVHALANTTDLQKLGYDKFCEILQDLRSKDWLLNDEGALVVILAYFKRLFWRAWAEGSILKAAMIFTYFFRYIKNADMVQSIIELIESTGISHYVVAGALLITAICAAAGSYYLFKR